MRLLKAHKVWNWAYFLLLVLNFALGFWFKAWFELICAACAAWFWAVQQTLMALGKKEEQVQKKWCHLTGVLLLPPSLGAIAAGVLLLYWPLPALPVWASYEVVAVSSVMSVCLLIQIIFIPKPATIAGRFLRLTRWASLAAPCSLALTRTLVISQADSAITMSCMSMGIFGTLAALLCADMILVSLCGYQTTRESFKTCSNFFKDKRLGIVRIGIFKDSFLVASKTAISVVSLSFFMFANALYSGGMGVARFHAVRMHNQTGARQIKSYRLVGIIISAASICYVIYSVRLFEGGKTAAYSMHIALVIALYTFVEFWINIRDAIHLHKSNALGAKALRAISFSSTLLSFVLTQTAIMSFATTGDNSFTNALAGCVFGSLAALVGLYLVIDSFLQKKQFMAQQED